jgi:hypothetical protein
VRFFDEQILLQKTLFFLYIGSPQYLQYLLIFDIFFGLLTLLNDAEQDMEQKVFFLFSYEIGDLHSLHSFGLFK